MICYRFLDTWVFGIDSLTIISLRLRQPDVMVARNSCHLHNDTFTHATAGEMHFSQSSPLYVTSHNNDVEILERSRTPRPEVFIIQIT